MRTPILATKLYIPPPRPNLILRPRLIERLNEGFRQNHGFGRKLTLISAPAGFGKTTLASDWIASEGGLVAWLSLDEGDNEPTRFLAYLIAALQTLALSTAEGVVPKIGDSVSVLLQSPQPPPIETILTALINEINTLPENFIFFLDDYHVLDAKPIDDALTFLLEHLPRQMHLVITTREDPPLPLARYRVRGQLTEIRSADLRFTPVEAAEFLNQMMGLELAAEEIAALETRTEGWIAGLQLAALSMQGQQNASRFIQSFTGSNRFVMDYLVEEVLHQQSDGIQQFLLHTSLLDRLCGPLCDAMLRDASLQDTSLQDIEGNRTLSGQATLEYLEQANLFIVPLDNERRWYRYHHLFAELLRQRLHHRMDGMIGDGSAGNGSAGNGGAGVAALHIRASIWYEEHGLDLEAFHHATAALDIDRAARLVEGEGMPLIFRGAAAPVCHWLASLPKAELDARPAMWVIYASALLFVNQPGEVEEKLQAAEAALASTQLDDGGLDEVIDSETGGGIGGEAGRETDANQRDLEGHIAAIRATLAVFHNDAETIVAESRRALAYLHPDNLPVRTATTWTLGFAYQLKGERAAAGRAYTEAIAISQEIGHFIIHLMSTIGLGKMQEIENQLRLATESYVSALNLAGDPPLPVASEAHLGMARILYEWNDLEAAEQHTQQSIDLARQAGNNDRTIAGEIFSAHLKLVRGDGAAATAILTKAAHAIRQHNFMLLLPELAAVQVRALLQQGNLAEADGLAQTHKLPLGQARVYLAQGNSSTALAILRPLQQEMAAKEWADEMLKVRVLQILSLYERGETELALQLLGEALALAEPNGFIRTFVDEGLPMAELLRAAVERAMMPEYTGKLLAAFGVEAQQRSDQTGSAHSPSPNPKPRPPSEPLIEPLSERELDVLRLLRSELSGPEIARELVVSLNTMRTHSKNIYSKLGVNNRRAAVRRAEELGLPFN